MKKFLYTLFFALCGIGAGAQEISLNGIWEYGTGREYAATGEVPGIHSDTGSPAPDTVWYRRSVTLPQGGWESATLELKGARFRPKVYVDGVLVSSQEGGMIRSFHPLACPSVRPGNTVTLEIALCSLKDVPREDASWIPKVDQWRSHCASALWDDVVLHLYNKGYIDRVLTWYDRPSGKARLKFRVVGSGDFTSRLTVSDGTSDLVCVSGKASGGENEVIIDCSGLEEWSPSDPSLYRLNVELFCSDDSPAYTYTQNFALRDFHIEDRQFVLNGKPLHLRGGTLVWHRWMRDPEGLALGWDTEWIEENMVKRLKDHGANYFRFHLGVPPERILDLCDRYGLAVQYEWNFFHGMPASYESLMEQYPKWFDLASRHPSVLLYHPYNETEGEKQLRTTWTALDRIVEDYPPVVMEERDVIHIHKYWWSLFENLGLYYDSYRQFPKAVMVDEFGGNYLDGQGNMGLYPSIRESYMRFLGPSHTAAERLHHLDRSCAKVSEYWRRIDAAGIAPFTMASSQEDGCNWFTGPLKEGKPKNVWDALTVLWSERAVSLDIWDCNFTPSQKLSVPAHFFNDGDSEALLDYEISILKDGVSVSSARYSHTSPAFSHQRENISITVPSEPGNYLLRAELLNPTPDVKSRVLSDWDIRVLEAKVPEEVRKLKVFVPDDEEEFLRFAGDQGLKRAGSIRKADAVLLGRTSFGHLERYARELEKAVERGVSVILLDVGETTLGQGYPQNASDLGPLQGVAKIKDAKVTTYPLFSGMTLVCKEMAEPESHIHPLLAEAADAENGSLDTGILWNNLDRHATDLWNGLRGGLIVPASDIEIEGLSSEAFLGQWTSRGADKEMITGDKGYYAYELCGFYGFSKEPKDKALEKQLREKVQFLIDDAPALAMSLNAKAPLRVTDLRSGYEHSRGGNAVSLTPLCCAGKNLTRTPVMMVGFGKKKGKVIVSQLITEGRLGGKKETVDYGVDFYGRRHDEAAVQTVLNMLLAIL